MAKERQELMLFILLILTPSAQGFSPVFSTRYRTTCRSASSFCSQRIRACVMQSMYQEQKNAGPGTSSDAAPAMLDIAGCRCTESDQNLAKSTEVRGVLDQEVAPPIVPKPLVPAERYQASDWFQCFLSLPFSFALRRVMSHLLANTIFAALVCLIYVSFPATMSFLIGNVSASHHALLGSALSLLLVFRTNSAYDRFWEARKVWGSVVRRMQELSRFGHSALSGTEREHFLQLLCALPLILIQHLRTGWKAHDSDDEKSIPKWEHDVWTALHKVLPPRDFRTLRRANNRPFMVLKMLGAILHKVYTDPAALLRRYGGGDGAAAAPDPLQVAVIEANVSVERRHCEQMLTMAAEAVSSCERIVKTTVPISFAHHTSRFLSVWCLTLPVSLVRTLGWRTVPVVAVVSWALLVIEEFGHVIEDPFNMWNPAQGLRYDEMLLERSLEGSRREIMERLPAA